MATKPKVLSLSIYLIKNKDLQDLELVKLDKADAPIDLDIGDGQARLYVKTDVVRQQPPWTQLFTALPEVPDDTFGRPNSVGAVLIYRAADATFLLSFGMGQHLVQQDAVERDFGLRVTLNSVNPNELRALDKATYTHRPLVSRNQSSRGVDIFDLDVDGESEMLYAITGLSQDPQLGPRVTGRDALTIQLAVQADALPALLAHALTRYRAQLPAAFEWVDNVQRVRDPDFLHLLDSVLDDMLVQPNGAMLWMGEPEIVDWEQVAGYQFDLRARTPMHPTLDLDHLTAHLHAAGESLCVDSLRRHWVHLVDANHQPLKTWHAYRCLNAEISEDDATYVLRNGNWLKVKPSFAAQVDESLRTLSIRDLALPEFQHASEGEYNDHVATTDASYYNLDANTIRLGGSYDKIEFCDLIKDHRTLIHVKFYRSSSTLSHLFAQGHVAAETFVKDEQFRERLNIKLPAASRLADPQARPDARQYSVIYAIATNKTLPAELPFFSKVTLKNATRTLRALNYDVALTRIPVNGDWLRTSKVRGNRP